MTWEMKALDMLAPSLPAWLTTTGGQRPCLPNHPAGVRVSCESRHHATAFSRQPQILPAFQRILEQAAGGDPNLAAARVDLEPGLGDELRVQISLDRFRSAFRTVAGILDKIGRA